MSPPSTAAPVRIRKRPIEIEAMHFDGTAQSATPIIDWVLANDGVASFDDGDDRVPSIRITTLEGEFRAPSGWWVLRGVRGEFYACEDSILAETYDFVETGDLLEDEDGAPFPGEVQDTRRFFLHRTDDVTGVHDDGLIAIGVQFADSTTVLRWLPGRAGGSGSVAVWPNLTDMEATHLHPRSNTSIVWVD